MNEEDKAPPNSLPTWRECSLRISNEDYLKENCLSDDGDTLLPNELHRFIYEYDDSDEYKSAWFMHRLEKLIKFIKDENKIKG
jgi:hypothetical protein